MSEEQVEDRRERRNRLVRQTLHEKAIDLAQERPIAEITAEEIADAAGISRRTFFNYFPSKNQAFVPDISDTPVDAMEDFRTGKYPDFFDALEHLLLARYAVRPGLEKLDRAFAVWCKNPELKPLRWEAIKGLEQKYREAVADRLGRDFDDPAVVAITAVMCGLEKAAIERSRDLISIPGHEHIKQVVRGAGNVIHGLRLEEEENEK